MVQDGRGRMNRTFTSNLPTPVRKVVDPAVDYFYAFIGFIYFFFMCLIDPTKQGTQGYVDANTYSKNVKIPPFLIVWQKINFIHFFNNRRNRPDDNDGRPRRRIGGFNRGSGVAAPPAGG